MKYAILALISLFLLSLTIPAFETVRTVYLTELVSTPNDALYTLPQGNPLPGYVINSGYGMRMHPKHHTMCLHSGVDQACPIGTKVKAQGNGKVIKIEYVNSGYGNNITINHGLDESGKNVVSVKYAHLSKILVNVGEFVKQGDLLALTGNSGSSTGPHLHTEYRVNDIPKNPVNYVDFKDENHRLHQDSIIAIQMFERKYEKFHQLSKNEIISASNGLWGSSGR